MTSVAVSVQGFKNQHLSVSRLRRFEQCPLSFRLHYIDRLAAEPTTPLRFGTLLHAVLERLYQWAVEEEYAGPFDEDHVLALYREEWAHSGLSGLAIYEEGLEILRAYLHEHPDVDHRDVLAVEQDFRLEVGPFELVGKIDRVDRVADDTIEILDYKSNRAIYTREEVETDLQLTIYALAARTLWPWARHIRLGFYLLRHSMRQMTERTEDTLAAAREYIVALGHQTEQATEYPARINPNCQYCDHRRHCPAYDAAVAGQVEVVRSAPADLEAVAREREQVANLAKILYARKAELDDILKARLAVQDALELAGVRYSLQKAAVHVDYPLDATLRVFQEVAGVPQAEARSRLLAIDKAKVDMLVKELGKRMPRAQHRLLKTQLDALAEKTFSPRLYAKEMR